MAVWKLPYLQPYDSKPFLFYVAFGDDSWASKAEGWGGTLPAELQVTKGLADLFRSGAPWQMALREHASLAAEIAAVPAAVIIKGPVASHQSLDYLRETIELLTYLVDHGACAIYDPFALAWYRPTAWQELATDGGIFNPFDHVALLSTPETDGLTWLHTRGLRKFGRPDLSVRGLRTDELETVKKMLDRFINYQALGGVIEPGREVVMSGLSDVYRPGPTQGDIDDPEFDNMHIEIRKES